MSLSFWFRCVCRVFPGLLGARKYLRQNALSLGSFRHHKFRARLRLSVIFLRRQQLLQRCAYRARSLLQLTEYRHGLNRFHSCQRNLRAKIFLHLLLSARDGYERVLFFRLPVPNPQNRGQQLAQLIAWFDNLSASQDKNNFYAQTQSACRFLHLPPNQTWWRSETLVHWLRAKYQVVLNQLRKLECLAQHRMRYWRRRKF